MSADRARDPEELGVNHHLAFERLVQRAVLRDAGDGRFYVDELSWNALRRMRLRLAFGVIVFTIAVLIALFASGALVSRN